MIHHQDEQQENKNNKLADNGRCRDIKRRGEGVHNNREGRRQEGKKGKRKKIKGKDVRRTERKDTRNKKQSNNKKEA